MHKIPDYTNLSLALSTVLKESGINETIVSQRRRTYLFAETMEATEFSLFDRNTSVYHFGSQSEGSTTLGLRSDTDTLFCDKNFGVVSDWKDWRLGMNNLLLIEDETSPPGYCVLQCLREDMPLPCEELINDHCVRDIKGRVLLKNTFVKRSKYCKEGAIYHGPALSTEALPGYTAMDGVFAYPCLSTVQSVQQWLSETKRPWPTVDMKHYIANSVCFVVPVGCKTSENENLEWRISTSLAERCMMFGMNITQLQTYVLMKMLLKVRINSDIPDEYQISSFMCKNVLIWCIQNTAHGFWQNHRLIVCLMYCLSVLHSCAMNENCPHFIMHSNNLMAGRFTTSVKSKLQENFKFLFDDIVTNGLLCIKTDNVGFRLAVTCSQGPWFLQDEYHCLVISKTLYHKCTTSVQGTVFSLFKQITRKSSKIQIETLQIYMKHLQRIYRDGDPYECSASNALIPFLSTLLGSLMAAASIQSSKTVSPQAMDFLSMGLNSDLASSRLKLANILYCINDFHGAEVILRDVEERYHFNVCEPLCMCREFPKLNRHARLGAFCIGRNETDISKLSASCIISLHTERHLVPKELQYEMYRSTGYPFSPGSSCHFWTDWAVVDSLPYLYFLQFKVYQQLRNYTNQRRALNNLSFVIEMEPNLGHRETALNLLGQCIEQCPEQRNWHNGALHCYIQSLNVCPYNNAAKLHISRLAYRTLKQRKRDKFRSGIFIFICLIFFYFLWSLL